jgi:putative ABC transport system permease protein
VGASGHDHHGRQIATRASDLVPPYLVTIAWGEIAQLVTLFAVLFIAILIVLLIALRRMRVFQAIKLGESV